MAYETNEDLTWRKNEIGRLYVQFNGLSTRTFQSYCDQRQLQWFQRFYEDQEVEKASKDGYSSGLFTLRSGRIAWQEGTDKGEPWSYGRLIDNIKAQAAKLSIVVEEAPKKKPKKWRLLPIAITL